MNNEYIIILNAMFETIKTYVHSIQHADEATKKRALIIAATFSTIIIIMVWLMFLNFTLPRLEYVAQTPGAPALPAIEDSPWVTFKLGLQSITSDFQSKWSDVKGQFKTSAGVLKQRLEEQREILLEKDTLSVPLEEPEMIPPTVLP